jgi:hypothetical protein
MFFLADWMFVKDLSLERAVVVHGVGPVERNTAASIMIQRQARSCLGQKIIMMELVVGARRGSRKKTIVLADIAVIVERDGKSVFLQKYYHKVVFPIKRRSSSIGDDDVICFLHILLKLYWEINKGC